jgi:hypothetical protein
MTQGVSSWRRSEYDVSDGGDVPPPAGPDAPPAELDESRGYDKLPLFDRPLPVGALAGPAGASRDERIRDSLDAFIAILNAPYRTPEGLAWPGAPFRMVQKNEKPDLPEPDWGVLKAATDRVPLTDAQASDLKIGRGSPEAIHAVTQALIDAGKLPPPSAGSLEGRIRMMMFRYRIGLDCAGYVQLAYLRVMHLDRAAAHFKSAPFEDLSTLGTRGYTRIADIGSLRAGDIFSLGPPPGAESGEPGHRAIVYDQRLATDDEVSDLRKFGSEGVDLAAGGPIRILRVDSSWGSGGNPLVGGVRRETWIYNESKGTWGWLRPVVPGGPPVLDTASTPINHPFTPPFGVFRGAAARSD